MISHRPHLLHPFASAIDEPELKVPEEMVRVSFRACQCFFFYMCERDLISDRLDGAHDEVGTGVCAPARRKEKNFQGVSKAIAGGVAQEAQ